ncbi:unnamed protein product [Arctia plantaginis]|uniref:Uncharacterized protein n=1 Tax=Arctia plantaginis TaxID=874455 RepID=A0A8S0ZXP6_ARCPL|nr:unnamed protein product [Arctia plantaginis]CAB3226127.1 unnamed protein product [Arctia plantaginis]CAB3237868.1 unnamed protein product [Arctia plantaginis]
MIGRADIEGSKSNVAMNARLPQTSYPCGSTDSRATTVHAKPFSTSVLQGLTGVFATTTKICTDGGSRQAYAQTLLRTPSRTSYSLRPNNVSLSVAYARNGSVSAKRYSAIHFQSKTPISGEPLLTP